MQLKNIKYWSKLLLLTFLFFLSSVLIQIKAQADDLDDIIDEACEELSEEDCEDLRKEAEEQEDQYDTLENQLKNAKKLAKLKREQSRTLENQVQILNLEINDVQGDINSLQKEITTTQRKIDETKEQINLKQKSIKEGQKNLGEMLRSYYRLNQELGLSLISRNDTLSNVFNQSDHLSQLSTKINNSLKIIREEKSSLGEKKEEYEVKQGKLGNQKTELDEERQTLAITKNSKNSLLVRTQGEEANYQALIAKIESQMKQLLIDVDSLSDEQKGELNDILKNADKPKYGLASTSWYYSQTDSRWKNEKLGGSRYTIGDSGCAITSIAMVFTYYDEKVDPEDLADVSFFTSKGYIDWGSADDEFDMKLIKKTNHSSGNIDWDDLEDYIDHDQLVIVYIRAGSIYGPGHYVVVHGYDKKHDDFVVHDPYWGTNLLLGTSRDLVEELHSTSTKVDQMIVYKPD